MAINAGKAVGYLTLDSTNFQKGMKSAASSMTGFTSKTTLIDDKMKKVGTTLTGVGTTLTKSVTAPLVAAGVAVSSVGITFEKSMSKLQAVVGASESDLKRLEDTAIDMGASTVFSATEAADAMYAMGQAGWDTTQIIDGIAGVMDLAAAGELDLAAASDITVTALTAFGESADQTTRFADILAVTAAETTTGVEEIGNAFTYVAPIAGSFGYTLEDTSLAMGLLANNGIEASKAGTSLRKIMTETNGIVKITGKSLSKSGKEMGELEISTNNADGTMKPFKETMDNLRKAFANLTDAEKAKNAEDIAGKTGMAGLLAIVNASEEDYDSLAESIYNSAGAAEEMADVMNDNAAGALEELGGKLETLSIIIFQKMKPAIEEVIAFLGNLIDKVNGMSDAQITAIVKTLAFAAALGPILIVLGKIIGVLAPVVNLLANVGSVIGLVSSGTLKFGAAIADVFPKLGSLLSVLAPIAPALIAFSVAAAAVFAVFKYNEKTMDEQTKKTREFTDGVKDTIKALEDEKEAREDTVKSTESNISLVDKQIERLLELNKKENLSNAEKLEMKTLVDSLNQTMPELNAQLDAETGHLSSSVDMLKRYNESWKEKVRLQALEGAYAEQVEANLKIEMELAAAQEEQAIALQNLIDKENALEFARKNYGEFSLKYQTLKKDVNQARDAYDEITLSVWNLSGKLREGEGVAEDYANQISDTSAQQAAADSIVNVSEAYKTAYQRIKESGESISKDTRKAFNEAVKSAEEAGIEIPASIAKNLASGKISIEEATKLITKAVKKETKETKDEVDKTSKETSKAYKDGIVSEKSGAEAAADTLVKPIEDKTKKAKDTVKKNGESTSKGYASGLESGESDVSSASENVASSAKEPLEGVSLYNSGTNVIQGFLNGIGSKISALLSSAANAASSFLSKFNNTLGIRSPSKKMFENGEYSVIGYINGIKSKKENVKKTAKELAELTLSSAKTWLDNYKVYHDVSLQEEVDYWNRVRKEIKSGTQARIDADKEYYNAKKALNEALTKMEEDYQNDVADLNKKYAEDQQKVTDQLKSDIESLTKAYTDAVASRASSIMSSMNLFDAYAASTEQTSASLIGNLQSQIAGLESWTKDLASLREKGVDESFVQMLEEMGVSAAGEVAVIANMTEAELANYVALWKEKMALAEAEATKQLEPMKVETETQIKELQKTAQTELKELTKTYNKELKALGKEAAATAKSAGKNTMVALIAGINSQKSALQSALSSIASTVSSAMSSMSSGASIAGSARSFVADGSHADGLDYVPFDGYRAILHEGERVLTKEENAQGANGGTYNFYGTPPLDEKETARQFKLAQQEILLGF